MQHQLRFKPLQLQQLSNMAARIRSLVGLARCMHSSCRAQALTEFKMPAMSPTMSSGKISSWKVKEGDSFSAGDILCAVETDKAEVDIEAQDDGIMGKIFLDEKESSIDVGTVIAMLAEEGDDISNIQAPSASTSSSPSSSSSAKETSASSSKPSSSDDLSDYKTVEAHKSSTHVSSSPNTPGAAQMPSEGQTHGHGDPKHSMPLMPSVLRLLKDANISDATKITATGFKGRLTKGDVLAHLGKVSNPLGSASKLEEIKQKGEDRPKVAGYGATGAKQEKQGPPKSQEIMSGAEFRRWIASGLAKTEKLQQQQATSPLISTPVPVITFDDVLDGYLPRTSTVPKTSAPLPSAPKTNSWDDVLGL